MFYLYSYIRSVYIPKMPDAIGTRKPADEIFRKNLVDVVKRSSKDHKWIAEQLTLHAGQTISKRMLDDWTAESKKRARFPAALIAPICEVLGNDALQRHVIGPRLRKLLEFAERELEVRELRRELLTSEKQSHWKRKRNNRLQKPQHGQA